MAPREIKSGIGPMTQPISETIEAIEAGDVLAYAVIEIHRHPDTPIEAGEVRIGSMISRFSVVAPELHGPLADAVARVAANMEEERPHGVPLN